MLTRALTSSAVLLCLLAPSSAKAQFNHHWLPIERGLVESHADVQLQYSRADVASVASTDTKDVALLAIEGQYAIKDRYEVGLGVPIVAHNYAAGMGAGGDTGFGDILLNFKIKLFNLGENFGMAAYTNIMLPTHSEAPHRKYSMLLAGAAASAKLLGIRVGGALGVIWFIQGNDASDLAFMNVDLYAGYSFFGILTLKLGVQYANSIHPNADEINALAFVPGVEVDLFDILRVGLAGRIATTDEAKALYRGRFNLLFHAGVAF